jgi:hypothetical protein
VLLQLKATCRNTVRKRWIQCRCQPLRILSSRLELGRCSAECPWVCPSSRTIRLRRRVRLCLKRPKSRQTSMRWKIGSVPSEGGAAENRPALLPHPSQQGAVWKRGSIASEPEVFSPGQLYMLVDTASRPGMSGSPVIRRSWGTHQMKGGGVALGAATAIEFVGVFWASDCHRPARRAVGNCMAGTVCYRDRGWGQARSVERMADRHPNRAVQWRSEARSTAT